GIYKSRPIILVRGARLVNWMLAEGGLEIDAAKAAELAKVVISKTFDARPGAVFAMLGAKSPPRAMFSFILS
ncbi:MAG: hypothetical protein KGI84_09425, partial [Elusimicrobia bacterium]|nr:hypothetical protein [Elusimicrobiota bacterium]